MIETESGVFLEKTKKDEILTPETKIDKSVKPVLAMSNEKIVIETKTLDFYYNADAHALKNINIHIPDKKVTAFIGPSGCGKSTLLRCFNRMNDLIPNTRVEGSIHIDNKDIYGVDVDVVDDSHCSALLCGVLLLCREPSVLVPVSLSSRSRPSSCPSARR